jgi:hypothetical protein
MEQTEIGINLLPYIFEADVIGDKYYASCTNGVINIYWCVYNRIFMVNIDQWNIYNFYHKKI